MNVPDMPDAHSSCSASGNLAGRPQVSVKDVRSFAFDDFTQLFGQSYRSQPSHDPRLRRIAQLDRSRQAVAPCGFDRALLKNAGPGIESKLPLIIHKLGGKALGAAMPKRWDDVQNLQTTPEPIS